MNGGEREREREGREEEGGWSQFKNYFLKYLFYNYLKYLISYLKN